MNAIKKVPFNGNKILVVEKADKKYVAMKPITEALGLDWSGQLKIIRNDPVLNEGMDVTSIPSRGGKRRKSGDSLSAA
ncbi:MAG: phage antirepressor N-terminal domain-containing protein [Victivallales bacterium]